MTTRPDPELSGTVEIATRRRPRLRVMWDLREPTLYINIENPGYGAFPPNSIQFPSILPVGALVLRSPLTASNTCDRRAAPDLPLRMLPNEATYGSISFHNVPKVFTNDTALIFPSSRPAPSCTTTSIPRENPTPFSHNPHEKYRCCQSDINQLPALCRVLYIICLTVTRRVLVSPECKFHLNQTRFSLLLVFIP